MTAYRFVLPDIRCVRCESAIEKALEAYRRSDKPRVKILNYAVDVSRKEVTVEVAENGSCPERIQTALRTLFREHGFNPGQSSASPARAHWIQGGIGVVSGAVLFAFSLAHVVFPLPVLIGIASLSTGLTLALGAKSYQRAFASRTQTMDSLFAMSTLTILITSVAALFFPGLPMMFETALFIFGFQHLGEGMKQSLQYSMSGEGDFQDRAALTITVMDARNHQIQKPLAEVKPGETVLIQPGEVVSLDGICQSESCRLVETIVTGSLMPKTFNSGKEILAGMQVAHDSTPLVLSVTATAGDSYLARLDQQIYQMKQKTSEKAALQTTANKILDYFIPAVLLIAAVSAVVVGYFVSLDLAIKCASAVLVAACPCTLGAIPPLALNIGMKKAAAYGVQFKSAKALEAAEQSEAVVFDLNGTLTLGAPEVVSDHFIEEALGSHADPRAAFLSLLAAMEATSQHPFAKAIRNYVHSQQEIRLDSLAASIDASHHSGVCAEISEDAYVLGNAALMETYGISVENLADEPKTREQSVVYLAKNKQVIGSVFLHDPLREHAKYTIDALKKMGKTVYLCTGSDAATAHRYAEMLGISPENVRADFRGSEDPSKNQKMAFIRELQQDHGRKTAMVGDAGNDVLAVAASDFGIAIESKHGDAVTRAQAGAVIQNGSLLPVLTAFQSAQETVHHLKQNLLFSLGYNLISLFVAAGGGLLLGITVPPALCAWMMILQSVLVMANSGRIQKQPLQVMPPEEAAPQADVLSCCSSYQRTMRSMLPNGSQAKQSVKPALPERSAGGNPTTAVKSAQQPKLPAYPSPIAVTRFG